MGTVIGIANQKGGVGKTTSVIEIANNLAVFDKKVLVMDIDPQADLSMYVNADLTKPTMYDVLHAKVHVKDAIQTIGRIDVIPGSESLSKADREFVEVDDVFLLCDLIEVIPEEYDYILVDTGPARNVLLTMAYNASDFIIIPTVPDDGSLEGVSNVYRDICKLRSGRLQSSHAKVLALILNNYRANQNNDMQKLDNLKYLKSQIEEDPEVYTVRTSTKTCECKTAKKAIMDHDKNSNAAIDFRDLTFDLIEKLEAEDEK